MSATWTTSSWQTAESTGSSATSTTPPSSSATTSTHPTRTATGSSAARLTARTTPRTTNCPRTPSIPMSCSPRPGSEHLDPRTAADEKAGTFADTPWAGLHAELTALFGADAVGIFGSAMLGMHLNEDGGVRKDVDFVIEGAGNIPVLREHLHALRSRLGFTEVTSARQGRQYERYRRVFRHENNSTGLVISRRWTALQASNGVVTTIRFRDGAVRMPCQLAGAFPVQAKDITVTGQVADADLANLFPRVFRLVTVGYTYTVHLWWWKFASPVRDGDIVTVCGSRRDVLGPDVIRVSSFTSHWLQIHNP